MSQNKNTIFLSWSGYNETSYKAAEIMYEWINKMFDNVEPWISSFDIRKGSDSMNSLNSALVESKYAIFFLTHKNKNNPWLYYEFGSLINSAEPAGCTSILLDFEMEWLDKPFKDMQLARLNDRDLKMLFEDINSALSVPIPMSKLNSKFDDTVDKYKKRLKGVIVQNSLFKEPDIDDKLDVISRDIKILNQNTLRKKVHLTHHIIVTHQIIVTWKMEDLPNNVKIEVNRNFNIYNEVLKFDLDKIVCAIRDVDVGGPTAYIYVCSSDEEKLSIFKERLKKDFSIQSFELERLHK